MRPRAFTGLVFLLVGVCLIRVFSGDPSSASQKEKATLIQGGVLTERQREHSKLFKGYGSGQKVSDLAREDGEIVIRSATPLSGGVPDSPITTLSQALKNDACIADAIVTGTVRGKSSQLTENGEFIFTDYEFTVDDVVKENSSSAIRTDGEITVTGPGGTILLSGKRIRAIDSILAPLTAGQRYLLFLKFIPATDSYREIQSGGSFRLNENTVTKDSEASLHGLEIKSDVIPFLLEVRTAARVPCDRGGAK